MKMASEFICSLLHPSMKVLHINGYDWSDLRPVNSSYLSLFESVDRPLLVLAREGFTIGEEFERNVKVNPSLANTSIGLSTLSNRDKYEEFISNRELFPAWNPRE